MLTHDSVWVAEEGGKIVGMVISMYAHHFFWPFIICMEEGTEPWRLFVFLRGVFRDVMKKGIQNYLVDKDAIPEFAKIAKENGAALMSPGGGWYGGKIADLIKEKPRMSLRDAVKQGSSAGNC
jgi:hypothetical protein